MFQIVVHIELNEKLFSFFEAKNLKFLFLNFNKKM